MRTLSQLACLLTLVALAAPPAVAQEWGTLKGRFVYDGQPPKANAIVAADLRPQEMVPEPLLDESLVVDGKTRGIANVVVYVRTKDVNVHPRYAEAAKQAVRLDCQGYQFVPRVLCASAGQVIEFTNSDPSFHNVVYSPLGDVAGPPAGVRAGGTAPYVGVRSQLMPQPVDDLRFRWMKAHILVRSNPYAAVTRADGTFELKDLPTGDLEFQVWHEKSGFYLRTPAWEKGRFTLTIKAGDNTLSADGAAIKISPEVFQRDN